MFTTTLNTSSASARKYISRSTSNTSLIRSRPRWPHKYVLFDPPHHTFRLHAAGRRKYDRSADAAARRGRPAVSEVRGSHAAARANIGLPRPPRKHCPPFRHSRKTFAVEGHGGIYRRDHGGAFPARIFKRRRVGGVGRDRSLRRLLGLPGAEPICVQDG